MSSDLKTPNAYIESLPTDKKLAMTELRKVILKNLPKGFQETMAYGIIGYVVPHSTYPAGYHCDVNQPLPFIAIAAQKNFIAVYHMGLYAHKPLLEWFITTYKDKVKTKLDMGKSCIRFKKPEQIPFELIGELTSKLSPAAWIKIYEKELKR
jgi:hypothetical protein